MSRKLFASFIEYAAKGCVTAEEARRFMNAPTDDAMMLNAREELQRLLPLSWSNRLGKMPEGAIPEAAINRLYSLARELRESSPL